MSHPFLPSAASAMLLCATLALGTSPLQAQSATPSRPAVGRVHEAPTSAVQLGSDIPSDWNEPTGDQDFSKRDVMIPMRDGVKLHTVILVPRGSAGAPMLLERTPYDASSFMSGNSPRLHDRLFLDYFAEQTTVKGRGSAVARTGGDDYQAMLDAGSAGDYWPWGRGGIARSTVPATISVP